MSRRLAFGLLWLLAPSVAAAEDLNFYTCGRSFPAACATVRHVEFSGNRLTLVVANSSDAALHPDVFIGRMLFQFSGPTPGLASNFAMVTYGNVTEKWQVDAATGNIGGLGGDWDFDLSDNVSKKQGGDPAGRIRAGDVATIVIDLAEPVEALALEGFSAHLQNVGSSDWSVTPEPVTITLLGTGLLGLGGVGLFRRKRPRANGGGGSSGEVE